MLYHENEMVYKGGSNAGEVLNTLKAFNKEPHVKPFKISETYKAAWKQRNAADLGGENEEVETDIEPQPKLRQKPKNGKAKSKPKKPKRMPASEETKKRSFGECGASYEPHVYKDQRSKFIEAQKATGCTHAVACVAWNLSQDKAKLLSAVPVPELVRRRFLPKGAKNNPWAS